MLVEQKMGEGSVGEHAYSGYSDSFQRNEKRARVSHIAFPVELHSFAT